MTEFRTLVLLTGLSAALFTLACQQAPQEQPTEENTAAADVEEIAAAPEEVVFEAAFPDHVSTDELSEQDVEMQAAKHSHEDGAEHDHAEGDEDHADDGSHVDAPGGDDHSHGPDEGHSHDDGV